jgi:hypothetical protein
MKAQQSAKLRELKEAFGTVGIHTLEYCFCCKKLQVGVYNYFFAIF